ncbi:TPA: phage tail family protein [Streptococcus suis]|nr:phage tail family protein [Streptococcus suis]HEM5208046.1 phage tail family protein [Streptococcus suis]HEM5235374.1 phage tail family protein [Streptococcus suis]HEM5241429.1 phage tail family protein [Streptococcus suis]
MSVVTFTFNGVDFSELVEVHDIRRDIGNDTSIELGEISNIGSSLISSSEGPKYIEIDFSIWTPSRNPLKHKIAGLFHTEGVAKLTFSDEPDKYYLAKKTGKVSMRETEGYRSVGTVTFLIPDGVAHSTAYKTFQAPTTSSTKLTFDITNNGNVPAYPIIDINHTSENGYLGFVCVEKDAKSDQPMSSMMEIGSRTKVAQTPIQRSATVINYSDMSVALSSASRNSAVPGFNKSFSMDFTTVAGPNGSKRLGPVATNYTGEEAGSLTWEIPQNASNTVSERIAWNMTVFAHMYSLVLPSIAICVSDTNGQFLHGVEFRKSYIGNVYHMLIYTADGADGMKVVKTQEFSIFSTTFGLKGDNIAISRSKQTLTVTYPGGTFTVQSPEIKDKVAKKIHAVYTRSGQGEAFFGIHSLSYRRDFTEQPREVPNRYANGSVVNIDCEKDRIVVNGLDQTNDLVHGSDFLVIPPGKSTLEVYSSDFATSPPRVEIKFEERWL